MILFNNLFFYELNALLLQSVSNSFQMTVIFALSLVVIILTVVVLLYLYHILQVVLKVSGSTVPEESLGVTWINYLYILTLAMGIISWYIYSTFS
ncbi:MAG: hypothetical protein HWD62_16125 [Cyclobacteriaceae bacterium]|nr:MAG: hypothetical protein HWD62_16125 [Cyclobacteriaceae bacterium]